MEVELIEFGGEDDHVHLMVCSPPKLAIANLVGKLKGKSSYYLLDKNKAMGTDGINIQTSEGYYLEPVALIVHGGF